MTPESKQKAGRVTHTPHPEAETGPKEEGGRPQDAVAHHQQHTIKQKC